MSYTDKAAEFRSKALHFYRRASAYRDTGLITIADELQDVARQFEKAADYLSGTPQLNETPADRVFLNSIGVKAL